MAERRMFSKDITESDAFLDMPLSTQAFYFHLCMYADDDGFLGGYRKIMRMCGASQDEYDILKGKKFILEFDEGIVVIKHWLMHNYLRKDRYKPTSYIKEKSMLFVKQNKAYTFDQKQGLPLGIPMVDAGKDSIDKGSKEKDSISKIIEHYKTCSSLPQPQKITDKRRSNINARLEDYGYDTVIEVIDKAEASSFLSKSNKHNWLNFDWIFNPNNFVKILEDKYTEEQDDDEARIEALKRMMGE